MNVVAQIYLCLRPRLFKKDRRAPHLDREQHTFRRVTRRTDSTHRDVVTHASDLPTASGLRATLTAASYVLGPMSSRNRSVHLTPPTSDLSLPPVSAPYPFSL